MKDNLRRGPLSGIRVVAVEQFGAGPLATLYLADLGAEVIKVEDPTAGGDIGRHIPPEATQGGSLYFEAFNRSKRSIALDLRTLAGRQAFESLIADADAVFSNLRGGLALELGLTYKQLRHVNPKIVCVALTGYGNNGDRATLPAYDALIQAEVGWAAMTGGPDGPPTKSGLSLVDYVGGLTGALALVSRVMEAKTTNVGGDASVDLYRSALAMFTYQATWWLSRGYPTERLPGSAHASIVPFQFFETLDGHLAIACAKEKFYRQLVDVMGMPDLKNDSRFNTFAARRDNRQELVDILAKAFKQRSTDEWVTLLRGEVPVAPVRAPEQALSPSELESLGMLARYESSSQGVVASLGSPIENSGHRPEYRSAPSLGGDTDAVLSEVGMSEDQIRTLRTRGAFGHPPSG